MVHEVDTQTSFLAALSEEECSEIMLSSDVELEDKLVIKKDLQIDLNGYKLWAAVAEGITVSKGHVIFKNGTIIGPEDDPIVAEGMGTVVTLGSDLKVNATKCALYVKSRAKIIIEGADIQSLGDHAAVFVEGSGLAKDNTCLELRDGQIVATKQIAVSVKKGGIFLLSGGYLESKVDARNVDETSTIYLHGARTKMDMFGGEVKSEFTSALSVVDGAQAYIRGGLISSGTRTETTVSVQGQNSCLSMSNGKISGVDSDGILVGGLDKDQVNAVVVSGGVISVRSSRKVITEVAGEGQPAISITGGRFHGQLKLSYIEAGYTGQKDSLDYIDVIRDQDIPQLPDGPFDPDSSGGYMNPDPTISNKSVVVSRPVPVYGSPSRRFVICHIVGSVRIITTNHIDNTTGENYSFVEYVLAGVGRKATGYVLTSMIR